MLFGKENFFYHESIRNYVAFFGYIFNDIHVKSGDKFKKVIIRQANGNMYENINQEIDLRELIKIREEKFQNALLI